MVEHSAPSYCEEPRAERILAIVAMKIAECLYESVLSQVLGILSVFSVAIDEIEQLAVVFLHQRFEGYGLIRRI